MICKPLGNIAFATALLFGISDAKAVMTIQVNSVADEIDNDTGDGVCGTAAGTCTLRAAIMTANRAPPPGVVIMLPAGVYTLTRPAALNTDENGGDLNLTTPAAGKDIPIAIEGAGTDLTIVDGGAIDRVFNIDVGRAASFTDLTIRNGSAFNGAHFTGDSGGGGIRNESNVTLNHVIVSGNTAAQGGGIFNNGTMQIAQSTVSNNVAGNSGGGIYNAFLCVVNGSTVSGNTANDGGGISNDSGTTANGSSLVVTNSSIVENAALNDGGGLYDVAQQQVPIDIYNSTIAFNGADDDRSGDGSGGGIYAAYVGSGDGTPLNLYNTIIAGNVVQNLPVADDCNGPAPVNLHARNLFGSKANIAAYCPVTNHISGSTGLLNSTALLGPLQNNGGPTKTIALLPTSNAIDGGGANCFDINSAIIATDQRGFPRPVGTACDVGAYEFSDVIFKNGFE